MLELLWNCCAVDVKNDVESLGNTEGVVDTDRQTAASLSQWSVVHLVHTEAHIRADIVETVRIVTCHSIDHIEHSVCTYSEVVKLLVEKALRT